jgi:hypothetical protein
MKETKWRGLFRIGGVAFVVAGLLYIVLIGLLVTGGGKPSGAAELLTLLSEKKFLMRSVGAIFLVMYLCLMVAFPALFVALIRVNRAWPLAAMVIALTALMFDTISGLIVYALPSFALSATAAPSGLQSAYLVSMELAYNYIFQFETAAHVALVSLAILIFGLVMSKSFFGLGIAYTGIVLGSVGVVAAALFGFYFISIIWPTWFIPTGIKLYRLR